MRHLLLALTAVALLAVGPAVSLALAQTPAAAPRAVVSTFGVETSADDNIFSQARPTGDLVLRVRPGISFGQTSREMTWRATYGLDAERYQQHSDLSAFAGQNVGFNLARRVGPRSSLTWNGRYLSTLDQRLLNTLTDLNVGRVRTNHVDADMTFRRSLTPHTDVILGSSFDRSEGDQLGQTRSTTVEGRLLVRASPHADVFLHADARQFGIRDVVTSGNHQSASVSGGWTRRGRVTMVGVEAGVQLNDGEPGPRLALTLQRDFRSVTATTSYTRNVATALGVGGTIVFDNVQAGIRRRLSRSGSPHAWQAGVSGGVVQNRVLSGNVRAIQLTLDATKPITDALSIHLSYDRRLQQGSPAVTTSFGDRILRNQLSVGLTFSPGSSR